MKIQIIGTVIDIVIDANTVFFDEKGSKDFSEFLGRAGVSIGKAGATAALGSIIAAGITSGAGAAVAAGVFAAGAAPVLGVVLLVVAGYVFAATIVDNIDSEFEIKERAAIAAR